MQELNFVQQLAVWSLPVLFAITVHEVSHGWIARLLGDPTAMMLGRLTLNPIKHIDPVGTLLVPGILIIAGTLSGMGPVIFGWAKPVPVTWENLRHPKRDMAIVAAAGPLANLVMAVLWALLMKVSLVLGPGLGWMAMPLSYMGFAGISINIVLMVLNLLPIPPLDGGRVLSGLLPNTWAWKLNRIEPYGFIILLALMFTGALGWLLGPVIGLFESAMFRVIGL